MSVNPYDSITQLEILVDHFHLLVDCVSRNKDLASKPELVRAWDWILTDSLDTIYAYFIPLKNELQQTLLDRREKKQQEIFKTLSVNCQFIIDLGIDGFCHFEQSRNKLINEMCMSWMYDMSDETILGLFEKAYSDYKSKNMRRIAIIYQQDYEDALKDNTDERKIKTNLATDRRYKLFCNKPYGEIYHNNGRKLDLLAKTIILDKNKNFLEIHKFIDLLLSYEYAEKQSENTDTIQLQNGIFNENADVRAIYQKLAEFIDCKVITAQRHWFIVYLVFKNKGWLIKETQTAFRDQINGFFVNILKVGKDFKDIDSYFKNTKLQDWNPKDPFAPQCCADYINVAKALWEEFTEDRYALPGKRITTQRGYFR